MKSQKYSNYKDSGIEWIGKIPEHWEVKRLKDVGNSIIGVTYDPEDVLDNNQGGILVLRSSNIQNGKLSLLDTLYINKKINTKQILKKGDILICSRNGSRALIGKNITIDERVEGQTFGAFMTVYRSKFFRYISNFFNSNMFESQSGLFGSSTINQLTISTLNNFSFPLPPLSEQIAIANYLDKQTQTIDRKIELLSKKADTYKSLKQSLINEVVTGQRIIVEQKTNLVEFPTKKSKSKETTLLKAASPNLNKLRYKDSGIEWIGKIPEHWEVKRLKDVNTTSKPILPSNLKDEDLIEFLPMTNVDENFGKIKFFNFAPIKEVLNGYTKFQNGDVIFAKITPCMENGNCAIVNNLKYNIGFGSSEFMVFRPIKNLLSKYLHYFLYNGLFRKNAEPFMKGSAGQKRVTYNYMITHPFPLPPLSEQIAIANYLDVQCNQIDKIVETIYLQIDKLKELRKSLINEVVTGKVKV